MLFLDKLLVRVTQNKEQMLVFSCFTSMLNILEDYCIMRKWNYCRLDGSTDLEDREKSINSFTAEGSTD